LSLAQRDQHPLALLFVDLNGFKAINDRHGHLCGDAILQEAARRLERCVRASDTVTRFGGDEFVVLLHASNPKADGVNSIAEKIAHAIREPIVVDGVAISISASVGIACYPDHGATLDELINHADKAMYALKRKL
jgi:diguanylate cyclase (GGDEF)-like protein